MTHIREWSLFLYVSVALGCTPIYESQYPYEEGWRTATVTHLVRIDEAISATTDCRHAVGRAVTSDSLFARVIYSNARNVRSAIVLVEDGLAPRAGDTVYVNPSDCTRSLVR